MQTKYEIDYSTSFIQLVLVLLFFQHMNINGVIEEGRGGLSFAGLAFFQVLQILLDSPAQQLREIIS